MTVTRATGAALLTPEEVGELVVLPLRTESVAGRVGTFRPTSQAVYRLPIVKSDPDAEWVAEGDEIPVSEGELDELETAFKKLAGLTVVSNEFVDDSEDGPEVIGNGLVRDLSVKLDVAFFGTRGSNVKRPDGLEDLTGVSDVDAGTAWANTDPFNEAIFGAAGVGRTVTSFVANPADALLMANLKESSTSNKNLLQPDATRPGARMIAGVPLETSPGVTVGTVWGIPQAVCYVIVREDADVSADSSVFYTSDRTAVRGKLRADFLFPQPAAIQKISLTA